VPPPRPRFSRPARLIMYLLQSGSAALKRMFCLLDNEADYGTLRGTDQPGIAPPVMEELLVIVLLPGKLTLLV
jgi:hypothetical protein